MILGKWTQKNKNQLSKLYMNSLCNKEVLSVVQFWSEVSEAMGKSQQMAVPSEVVRDIKYILRFDIYFMPIGNSFEQSRSKMVVRYSVGLN